MKYYAAVMFEETDQMVDIARAAEAEGFTTYTTEGTMARWDQGANTVLAADGAEAAEQLHAEMAATGTNTINIRIHVVGLSPAYIRDQLELHGELVERLKQLISDSDFSSPGQD